MATITAAQQNDLIRLAVAMFDAAPGSTYLTEIAGLLTANGGSLQRVASILETTPVFKSLYPDDQSAFEFADTFLGNLGLANNAIAREFVISRLTSTNTSSKGQLILDAVNALVAATDPAFADARAQLLNKVDVATHFSVTRSVSETDLGALQAVLDGVTADPGSAVVAKEAIDDAIGPLPTNGRTLTTGRDNITTSIGNDTVTATALTLENGDRVTDPSTLDDDAILIRATTNVTSGFALTNIERMFVDATGAAIDVSLANVTGLREFWSDGSTTSVNVRSISNTSIQFGLRNTNQSLSLALDQAAGGGSDTLRLALSNASGGDVTVNAEVGQGFELATVQSLGANNTIGFIGGLGLVALRSLQLSGAAPLAISETLGGVGLPFLRTIDASTLSGGLSTTNGAEIVSNSLGLTVITGAGSDNVAIEHNTEGGIPGVNTTVELGDGNDRVSLRSTITVPSSAIIIEGGNGDDVVSVGGFMGAGSLFIDGGAGNDVVEFTRSFTAVAGRFTNVEAVRFSPEGAEPFRLDLSVIADPLSITGSAFDDEIIGGLANDTISGGRGNDTLVGGGGNDTLNGGDGDDTFAVNFGDSGADAISSGRGDDSLIVAPSLLFSALPIRVSFNSAGVGNGVTTDSSAASPQDNGLAVRIQEQDGSTGDLVGAIVRADDEGLTVSSPVTGVTFDVRDLLTGFQYGNDYGQVAFGTDAADLIGLRDDNDYVNGGRGADTVFAGGGDDFIEGGEGSDLLNGQDGSDSFIGGAGDDVINGGAGRDTIVRYNLATDGSDSINGGTGQDVVQVSATGATQVRLSFTSAEVGNGSAFDSTSPNSVAPLLNHDGGLAIRVQAETAGTDVTLGSVGRSDDEGVTFVAVGNLTFDVRDVVTGQQRGSAFNTASFGSSGSDELIGTDRNDYINAGAGDDALVGDVGNDFLVGGFGDDDLFGGGGVDSLLGGDGNDFLSGGDGIDSLNGGMGADTLIGGGGDDTVEGGAGDDTMIYDLSRDGADTIMSGVGFDTVQLAAAGALQVRITLTSAQVGNNLTPELGAQVADRTVSVRAESGGTDTLIGSVGMLGDENVQVVAGTNSVPEVFVAGGLKFDVRESTGLAYGENFDVVRLGTAIGDSISGAATNDFIDGGVGNDTLVGGVGDDALLGGVGDDDLRGGSGDDVLVGGAGDDRLNGAIGADSFNGGAGDDLLELGETGGGSVDTAIFGSTGVANGVDTITGFVAGTTTGDVLDFSAFSIDGNTTATALTSARLLIFDDNPNAATAVQGRVVRLIDQVGGDAITTEAGLAAALSSGLLGGGGEFSNINMAANSRAVFITAANESPGSQFVFFATTGAAGLLSSADITVTLVGVLNNVDINDLTATNFLV